ncbi:PH domain-containing protein [Haladaptatus caseinilyticus]|uniref:PH domain-containing protein n=1 Tax=Haladaptatus caseinilyticus TaxID=2993314 RepID=UPI00224A8452|nr:PH domain-containing protein [Haladaptatus caseinilyticus]
MSEDDWLVLDDRETVRWRGRPRVATVLPAVLVGIVLVVLTLAVTVITGQRIVLVLVPFGVSVPLLSYLIVSNTRFVVTDRALYRKTGVLSRNVQRLSVDRVQNSSFRQGIRGSLLDYGTVEIEAAGGGRIRFDSIENSRDVRAIVDQHSTPESIPGTLDQWEAILTEVRALRSAMQGRETSR